MAMARYIGTCSPNTNCFNINCIESYRSVKHACFGKYIISRKPILGFQIQQNGRTVQQLFEKILKRIHKRHVRIHPTSRTDRGVHALEQYFHFDTELNIPAQQWKYAMNRALPVMFMLKM